MEVLRCTAVLQGGSYHGHLHLPNTLCVCAVLNHQKALRAADLQSFAPFVAAQGQQCGTEDLALLFSVNSRKGGLSYPVRILQVVMAQMRED